MGLGIHKLCLKGGKLEPALGDGTVEPNSGPFASLRDAQENACRQAVAQTGGDDDLNCVDLKLTWEEIPAE